MVSEKVYRESCEAESKTLQNSIHVYLCGVPASVIVSMPCVVHTYMIHYDYDTIYDHIARLELDVLVTYMVYITYSQYPP